MAILDSTDFGHGWYWKLGEIRRIAIPVWPGRKLAWTKLGDVSRLDLLVKEKMIPLICDRCVASDQGYGVHCQKCGCCKDIRVNWWFIASALTAVGIWYAAWKYLWPLFIHHVMKGCCHG